MRACLQILLHPCLLLGFLLYVLFLIFITRVLEVGRNCRSAGDNREGKKRYGMLLLKNFIVLRDLDHNNDSLNVHNSHRLLQEQL